MELRSNSAVEDAAIAWVIELEQRAGRSASDVRRSGSPADVESPPRLIEVKAYGGSARGEALWLEPRQYQEARTNSNFWLYIVDNIRQGDPDQFRLIQLGGEELQRLLGHAKKRHYYTLPVPVAVYDRLRH